MESTEQAVLDATKTWLKDVVIGLNLCPFAREAHVAERIRYVVSAAGTPEALRAQLAEELLLLQTLDPAKTETTLIIHPKVLADFLEYNDFLDDADQTLVDLDLEGVLWLEHFLQGLLTCETNVKKKQASKIKKCQSRRNQEHLKISNW